MCTSLNRDMTDSQWYSFNLNLINNDEDIDIYQLEITGMMASLISIQKSISLSSQLKIWLVPLMILQFYGIKPVKIPALKKINPPPKKKKNPKKTWKYLTPVLRVEKIKTL